MKRVTNQCTNITGNMNITELGTGYDFFKQVLTTPYYAIAYKILIPSVKTKKLLLLKNLIYMYQEFAFIHFMLNED